MEDRQINIATPAINELRTLLEKHLNLGAEVFIKPFRAHCEKHGWDWFGLEPKRVFNFNAMQLITAYRHGCYADDRRAQLQDSDYAYWVFHTGGCCAEGHQQLDGLVLSPDHGFWDRYFPPLGWRCGCYVIGARSERGILRVHGEPDKKLPGWWSRIDPRTELPPVIEEPWGTPHVPDVLLLLAAMIDGHSPKPDFG